jgi:lipopolysaccharide/colanic/teichoic acid biosynthesis glycosyltransferase
MLDLHLNEPNGTSVPEMDSPCGGDCKALPTWKRILDLACLLFAAPALIPIMVLIAAAIRLSSSGPIFFRQERVGLKGKRFVCLKFRTMKHAAETRSHEQHLAQLINSDAPMKKLDTADSRVLKIGVLLRAAGLDELPQVFNVLRGEMSLVGPRPCIPYEYEKYRPEHRARFEAVPGLTGLWQVSGKNNTTFQQMVNLDIRYAKSLSLLQDISILFRTFGVVFGQTAEVFQRKRLAGANQAFAPRSLPSQQMSSPRRPERHPLTSV